MKNILITGGAGFIGSHLVRLFVNNYKEYHIYNLDALTYAGNLENLKDMGKLMGFVKKDYPGEVDMGLVGKIAKSKLGN